MITFYLVQISERWIQVDRDWNTARSYQNNPDAILVLPTNYDKMPRHPHWDHVIAKRVAKEELPRLLLQVQAMPSYWPR